ncbi:MAG: immunity protein 32 [Thioalkalivibrio sp.]|nr:immunity protein 32 [Thioalkalivibrio sp.]
MLTVEHNPEIDAIEVFCDRDGLELLIDKLMRLKDRGGHTHLLTPGWAGDELSEALQREGNKLFNHLVIALAPDDYKGGDEERFLGSNST